MLLNPRMRGAFESKRVRRMDCEELRGIVRVVEEARRQYV
jgi:hypothetical protein